MNRSRLAPYPIWRLPIHHGARAGHCELHCLCNGYTLVSASTSLIGNQLALASHNRKLHYTHLHCDFSSITCDAVTRALIFATPPLLPNAATKKFKFIH